MREKTATTHRHPHPYTFEKAREAVLMIQTLRPTLSSSELETLTLLLDKEALETIEKSVEEAEQGRLEPLEEVVAR